MLSLLYKQIVLVYLLIFYTANHINGKVVNTTQTYEYTKVRYHAVHLDQKYMRLTATHNEWAK